MLAHNLIRWTVRLGEAPPADQLTVAPPSAPASAIPGRLVNRSRQWVVRLSARWPWAESISTALDQICSFPLLG